MRPVTKTQTGVGTTTAIPFQINKDTFSVGLGVIVSGTVTYTVQHTFDDVTVVGLDPATIKWFNNSTLTNQTVSNDGNYAFPVQAIRLNVTAGTGTATLIAIQTGVGV